MEKLLSQFTGNQGMLIGAAILAAVFIVPNWPKIKAKYQEWQANKAAKKQNVVLPNAAKTGGNFSASSFQQVHATLASLFEYFRGDPDGTAYVAAIGNYVYKKQVEEATAPPVASPVDPTDIEHRVVMLEEFAKSKLGIA